MRSHISVSASPFLWLRAESRGLALTYSGREQMGSWFARFERPQALTYIVAQQSEGNSPEACRIAVEPPQRRLQQQHGSQRIVALQMMERRAYLDQPLQERLLRLGRPQPHAFPGFVRGKELARLVQSQAFRQSAFGPIEFHILRPSSTIHPQASMESCGVQPCSRTKLQESARRCSQMLCPHSTISRGSRDGCTLFASVEVQKGIPTSGMHRLRDALPFPRRSLEFL